MRSEFDRSRGSSFTAPVKVGDELDVAIEAVGEKGDGLAKKNGFVLFVPNTKQGDNVRIKITRVLRKVGFAEVIGQATGAPTTEGAPASETPGEEKAEDTETFGDEEATEEPEGEQEEESDSQEEGA
ncbi:TRAM domain-containing protein [Candidatus Woesearchaeota archaeon]|nr:TRAM domain-containing protein [Candidatus Woesearchaeota archaeon]